MNILFVCLLLTVCSAKAEISAEISKTFMVQGGGEKGDKGNKGEKNTPEPRVRESGPARGQGEKTTPEPKPSEGPRQHNDPRGPVGG